MRRECLDHVPTLSERHLYRILQHYVAYFNGGRPHQGLLQRIPAREGLTATDGRGIIQCASVLGGLHHCAGRLMYP